MADDREIAPLPPSNEDEREIAPLLPSKEESGGYHSNDIDRRSSIQENSIRSDYEESNSLRSIPSKIIRRLAESTHSHHSQREKVLTSKPGIGHAAFLIRDAVLGQQVENPSAGAYNPYFTAADSSSVVEKFVAIYCHKLTTSRLLVRFLYGTVWVLVFLTFFEPPQWCRYERVFFDAHIENREEKFHICRQVLSLRGVPAGETDRNSTATVTYYYPNSQTIMLTSSEARTVEAVCISIITIFILLCIGRDGCSVQRYLRRGRARWNRVVQIICIVSIMIGIAFHKTRFHGFLRLILLISYSFGAQRDLKVLIKLLPEAFNILVLLFFLMLFYAFFGTVMFVGTEEGKKHFPSLVESLWTLWICVTTANYPDVMMPAYNENGWVALYFISFMIISFFFLMNVILASVVNEYETAIQQRRDEHTTIAEANLKRAFRLIDTDNSGRIEKEEIMALFCILNEDFPEFHRLSNDDTKLLFAVLDKDGSSTITEEEFMDFSNVLLLEFVKASDYVTFTQANFPKIAQSDAYQFFCDFVKSDIFEKAVDVIVALNAVVVSIQTYPELSRQEVMLDPKYFDGSIDTKWEFVETLFTVIYTLEVLVKVNVLGWKAYTEDQRNVFDFSITALAILSTSIVYYPNAYSDSRLIRLIIMARVFRIVRLMMTMDRFRLIGKISAQILPAAVNIFILLFCLMYFFAALGMELYGGLITRDPNNPRAFLLLNTDFSDNDYWANNFNDMFSGMNVLFNLLVVNNWTECEIGYEAVTQSKWVRLFFLSFHILGVILVNNLVMAFIINSFFEQLGFLREAEKRSAEVVGDSEAVIHHQRAFFEASNVTGTKTNLSGDYIARLRQSINLNAIRGHEREQLRQLFTQTSIERQDERVA